MEILLDKLVDSPDLPWPLYIKCITDDLSHALRKDKLCEEMGIPNQFSFRDREEITPINIVWECRPDLEWTKYIIRSSLGMRYANLPCDKDFLQTFGLSFIHSVEKAIEYLIKNNISIDTVCDGKKYTLASYDIPKVTNTIIFTKFIDSYNELYDDEKYFKENLLADKISNDAWISRLGTAGSIGAAKKEVEPKRPDVEESISVFDELLKTTAKISSVEQVVKMRADFLAIKNKVDEIGNNFELLVEEKRDNPENGYAEWLVCEKSKVMYKKDNYSNVLTSQFMKLLNVDLFVYYILCENTFILNREKSIPWIDGPDWSETFILDMTELDIMYAIDTLRDEGNISAIAQDGCLCLGMLLAGDEIDDECIDERPKEAFERLSIAANYYHPYGVIGLAYMFAKGIYVDKNIEIANALFELLKMYNIFNFCDINELCEDLEHTLLTAEGFYNPGERRTPFFTHRFIDDNSDVQKPLEENVLDSSNENSNKNKLELKIAGKIDDNKKEIEKNFEQINSINCCEITARDKQDESNAISKSYNSMNNKQPVVKENIVHNEEVSVNQNETEKSNDKKGEILDKDIKNHEFYSKELEQSFWDEAKKYIDKNMKIDSCYCAGTSDKADRKIQSAIKSYASNISSDDKPVVVFDATLLGGAEEGCLFTQKGVYIHNQGEKDVYFLKYKEIKSITIKGLFIKDVYINDIKVISAYLHDGKEAFCTLVEYLKLVEESAVSGDWLK